MSRPNSNHQEILIIDDNPENLRTLTVMLEDQHYKVRPAINANIGLKAARLKSPELILLDLVLPDMTGFELIACLKNDPLTTYIPIIISALSTIDDKIKAFNAGCVDYISKPFQAEEVLLRVKLHLELIQNRTKLQKNEQRFRQAIETLPFPVLMYTTAGEILIVNNTWQTITGFSRIQMHSIAHWVETACVPAVSPAGGIPLKEALAYLEAGEKEIRTKTGGNRHWVFNSTKLETLSDGQQTILSIAMDITERKKAEQALLLSNKRLTRVLESNVIGIMYCDNTGHVQEANDALLKMTGFSREDLTTGQLLWQKLTPAEYKNLDDLALKELRQRGSIAPYEKAFKHKNGEKIPVMVGLALLAELQTDFVCFIIDLSVQKIAEHQIQRSLAEKEVLLQEIHHRVKNNLQIISSIIGLQGRYIEDSHAKEMFDDTKNRIHTISLIHQLLYQSGDFGNIDIQKYIVALTNLLQQSQQDSSRNISFKIMAENLVLTLNKAIPCGLILNELVSNSLKHAFGTEAEGRIEIYFSRLPDYRFELRIKDNGSGFPDEKINQTSDSLGLKLVNSLIDQLHGNIQIVNNAGAEFIIQFPEERQAV